jgi:CheY-like chemotaxis protein
LNGPLAGLRVLIVEDEAMVAMLIEDFMIDLGCDIVGVAGTLEEGLAMVQALGTDLDGAVLDINLGGAKVFPIAELLDARGIRFVFATGYDAPEIDRRYADRPVIAKPYRLDALEALLLSAFARSD